MSSSHHADLMDRNLPRAKNTFPKQLVALPGSLSPSNRLFSSETQRGDTRHAVNKVQSLPNSQGAYTSKASIFQDANSRTTNDPIASSRIQRLSVLLLRRLTATQRLAIIPANSSGSSSVNIEMSKGLENREPGKLFQSLQRACQQQPFLRQLLGKFGRELADNLISVTPFTFFEVLEARWRTPIQSLEFSSDLQRFQQAAKVHHRMKLSLAKRPTTDLGIPTRQPPTPDFRDLALGKLAVVQDQGSCSFCMFECSFGTSNEDVLLPASASYHRCTDCQDTRFFEDEYMKDNPYKTSSSSPVSNTAQNGSQTVIPTYQIFIKPLSGDIFTLEVKSSDTVLDVKAKLSRSTAMNWDMQTLFSCGAVFRDQLSLSDYRIGHGATVEVIKRKFLGNQDITQFWRPLFCSRCPWRQVDVKLAKICPSCREEKLAILKHRHRAWTPFYNRMYADAGKPTPRHKQGNCMICTGLARMKCSGCPLVICVNCSVHLDNRCKGSLDILLYSFVAEHIRNDAFLLRADGGM